MNGNGKNNFYRTLNLRVEDKQALKFYTELKKVIEKDDDKEKEENE